MNAIIPFQYEKTEVRVFVDERGTPWWIAKDVCDVLGIANHRDATARLDDDEKDDVGFTDAIGRTQVTTIINEPGLYTLIFRSNKPDAKQFKRWITHEVLPSLRKHGGYTMPNRKGLPKTLGPVTKEYFCAFRVATSAGMVRKQAVLHANGAAKSITGFDILSLIGINPADIDPAAQKRKTAPIVSSSAEEFFAALRSLPPEVLSHVAEIRKDHLFLRLAVALAELRVRKQSFARQELYQALRAHSAFIRGNTVHRWMTSPLAETLNGPVKVWIFAANVLTEQPEPSAEAGKIIPFPAPTDEA